MVGCVTGEGILAAVGASQLLSLLSHICFSSFVVVEEALLARVLVCRKCAASDLVPWLMMKCAWASACLCLFVSPLGRFAFGFAFGCFAFSLKNAWGGSGDLGELMVGGGAAAAYSRAVVRVMAPELCGRSDSGGGEGRSLVMLVACCFRSAAVACGRSSFPSLFHSFLSDAAFITCWRER